MKELTLNPVREIHTKPRNGKISKSETVKNTTPNSFTPEIAVLSSTGIVQTVNDSWKLFEEEISPTGPTGLDYIGMNYPEICKNINGRFSEHSSIASHGILSVLNGSATSFELDYPCYIPSKKRWYHMSVIPLPDLTGAVVSHTDITEWKVMEKMKDDFINVASHELKTPITSLKGIVHILKLSFLKKVKGEGERLLSTMDSQLNKLTRIIGDLLDIYTIPGQEMILREEKFDFSELVLATVENVRNISPLHFISIKENEKIIFTGDRFRLEQVMTNLLTNAVKYSPQSNQVIISSLIKDKDILLSVQDFGIGVATEDLNNIFERFYRVNNGARFDGLGLGLFISSEIIKAHMGKLWVESDPGKGSTFHFSLPFN